MAIVAIALVALMGSLAVAVDVGRVITSAQRVQDVADAAALAAIQPRPSEDYAGASTRAFEMVSANNVTAGQTITCTNSDVTYQLPGDYVAHYGILGNGQEAVTVDTRSALTYFFAPALGLNGTTVHKRATCVLTPVTQYPVAPIWVSETTPLVYGQEITLLASGSAATNIPGSFGFLAPPTGSNDFLDLLQDYNLTNEFLASNAIAIDQVLHSNPGVKTGQWVQALGSSGYGRLARGTWPAYANDSFTDFRTDNPRILVLPICHYLGGSGSGAQYQVIRFASFWLESVDAGHGGTLTGRFIEYVAPGAIHGGPGAPTGVWTTALVN